jgi:hypothetical protein
VPIAVGWAACRFRELIISKAAFFVYALFERHIKVGVFANGLVVAF